MPSLTRQPFYSEPISAMGPGPITEDVSVGQRRHFLGGPKHGVSASFLGRLVAHVCCTSGGAGLSECSWDLRTLNHRSAGLSADLFSTTFRGMLTAHAKG